MTAMTRATLARLHHRPAPPDTPLPVFVYGTLRHEFGDFARVLACDAVRVDPATLPGAKLFDNQQYPYAVLTGHLSEVVVGDLVTIDRASYPQALARLDRHFGRVPGADTNRWERRRVTVRRGAVAHDAWVYIAADWLANRLRATLPSLRCGDWVRHVTSTWLAVHQRGRHGIGAHDGQGISWSTFDQTRGGVLARGWPGTATEVAFTNPAPGYDDPPDRHPNSRSSTAHRSKDRR